LWGLERKFVASYKKNPLVASKDLKFCRFKPENRKNKKKLLQARSKIEDRRYNKIKKLHGRGKKKEKERERERERKYQARSKLSRDKQQSLLQSNDNIPSLSRHERFSPNQT
jgi:hypothetical protein